jgi:hypothetical protein
VTVPLFPCNVVGVARSRGKVFVLSVCVFIVLFWRVVGCSGYAWELKRVTNGRDRQGLRRSFVFLVDLCLLTLGRKIAWVRETASARGG